MNQYRKRIGALEQKREQRLKVPIVIATISEVGTYVYNGNLYNEEQFRILMKKIKTDTIILDDTKLKRDGMFQ